MVLFDSHETGEFTICSGIGLEGDSVIVSDRDQHILQLLDHAHIALDLVSRCEGVNIRESLKRDRGHDDG